MQAYDELVERLVHLWRVSARKNGAARCTSGGKNSLGIETLHRLYSPAQDASSARALLPPFRPRPLSALVRRLSKTALVLGIVAILGFAPLQVLLQTSSFEAVVDARMITLRAPIDGEVQAGPRALVLGASLERGDVLFHIIDSHADHSRVDNLTRQVEQLKDDRPVIAARLANARMLLADLTEQTHLFTEARILQLEARQDELRAEVAAAQAKNEEAKTSLDRYRTLAGKGWLPTAQLNQAQRDGLVAEKLEAAAQKRLEAANVELMAARRGVFVGIANSDRPRYMRRADQLQQQASTLADTLAERDQRMIRLTEELAEEKARYAVLAAADMVAPAKGSVWEILTAPEERVHRGQDLLRVLDCGAAVVTVVVSEDVYNRLQVGSPARFRPRDGREDLSGTIILLTGPSASPANLAMRPSAPTLDSYHVTIAVPKLAEGHGCGVGRPGRVSFDALPMTPAPWERIVAVAR
jgi:multidrug resistance efflux pump